MSDFILPCLQPLLRKAGEHLANLIENQASFLCCYNSNAQNLRDEAQTLENTRRTVQQQVDAAERNLENIRPDVADWLDKAKEIQEKIRVLIDADNNVPKGCLSKWCPFLYYSSSREAKKTTDAIVKLPNDVKYESVSTPANLSSLPPRPDTSADFESRHLIEKEIMAALEDPSVYLIGLCGMGGVGKTTMAEKIMNQARTKTSMFDEVVWATVSRQQDLKKVQRQIAEGVGLTLEEESERLRADKLHARLAKAKSFLIILDDVWEELDLKKLGIPSQSTTERRKVIIISRFPDVLTNDSNICYRPKILKMKVLTEDEAWSFFQEKADMSDDSVHLHEVAKKVAKECNGLPLALVVVGSALRYKNERSWKDALRQLKRFTLHKDVYLRLSWSYDQLQDEEAKKIFLLCCLFPEDYGIYVEILVRYGWGLRMFSDIKNLSEARDRVHTLVGMLKSRFLLIGVGDEYVKMHDVIRDMAITIAFKDGHIFMVNDDRKEWPNKESYANYSHISVTLSGNFALPESINCPKLEFLRMELDEEEVVMPDKLFEGMRGLRVLEVFGFTSLPLSTFRLTNLRALHLEKCKLEMASLVGKLENLEFLNLRRSRFKELPKEVGQLRKLKLLDLTYCNELREIAPGVISGLVDLEELLMSHSFREWEAEEDGEERRNASLAEVASLKKLVTLEIDTRNPLSPNIRRFLVSLEMQKLERDCLGIGERTLVDGPYKNILCLKSDEESPLQEDSPLQNFCPSMTRNAEYITLKGDGCIAIINDLVAVQYSEVLNTNLKYLKLWDISNIMGIFSSQISKGNFNKLEKLEVKYYDNMKNILAPPMFRGLTSLTRLALSSCKELEEVIAQEESHEAQTNVEETLFPRLKELKLLNLPKMRRFCHKTNALKLPSLEEMEISWCPMLESFSMGSNDSNTKFLFNKEVLSSNLKRLWLVKVNCTGLFGCGTSEENFNGLEVLEVQHCDKLKNLFAPPMFRGLKNLKTLNLCGCEELEEVIAPDEVQEQNIKEILFPQLKELKLEDLPKMRRFCHMTNALKLPSLEEMHIRNCPMLESFFMRPNNSDTKFLFNKEVLCSNLKRLCLSKVNYTGLFGCGTSEENFNWLEVLDGCEELQEVIAPDEVQEQNIKEILFPQLKELKLEHLHCHMTNALKLPSLERMIIKDCSMLESCSINKEVLCTNFYKLEFETIIGATKLFENRISIDNFRWVGMLQVESFCSLKHFFSLPALRGLTNLKVLELKDCKELEEVIAMDSEEGQRKEILLPKLENLKLIELSKFQRFCHMTEGFELPSLRIITIDDCPEMETFSSGSLQLPSLQRVYGMKDPVLATKFFNKEKCSEEIHMDNSCFKLSATDLSIRWGGDTRYWDMYLKPDSSYGFLSVVEVREGLGQLEVNGRCTMANLSTAGAYEIFYVIMLKENASGWDDPANFRLTLPEGITHYRTENLEDKPRGQWLEILAGDFIVEPYKFGDFEFSLYWDDNYSKWELLIKGVIIRPKSKYVCNSRNES